MTDAKRADPQGFYARGVLFALCLLPLVYLNVKVIHEVLNRMEASAKQAEVDQSVEFIREALRDMPRDGVR